MTKRDDTDRLQELLDRGEEIPPGTYRTTRPLVTRSPMKRDVTVGTTIRTGDEIEAPGANKRG